MLVRLQCPSCGAELPPQDLDAVVTCQYCESRFETAQARSAKTVAGAELDQAALLDLVRAAQAELAQAQELADQHEQIHELLPDPAQAKPPGPSLLRRLLRRVIALAVIAVVLVVVLVVLINEGLFSLAQVPVLRDIELFHAVVDEVVDDRFDPQGGPPVIVEIGGQPAALVRVRRTGSELLFVTAFALPSGEKLWQLGPIDPGFDLAQLRFTSVGSFVVYSGARGHLSVHDLETGNLLRSLDAKQPIDNLCATTSKDGEPRVHVALSRGGQRLLEPAAGKLRRIQQTPSGCETFRRNEPDLTLIELDRVRNWIDDFEPLRVHLLGDRALVIGHEQRGPALPAPPRVMAVPYKNKAKGRIYLEDPLWNELAAGEHPEDQVAGKSSRASVIIGERVFVNWRELDGTLHMSARALADGALAWDTVLDPLGGYLRMLLGDPAFLLVARDRQVDVLDPSTGELLGALTPAQE